MKKSIAYLVLPLFAFMLGSCALGPIGPIDSSTSQSTSSSASSSSSNSSKTSSTSSSTSISSKTIYYTITWADYDGSILDTDEVEKGEMPSYSGQILTRSATAQYTYIFSGWTPTIVAATRDATYTAKRLPCLKDGIIIGVSHVGYIGTRKPSQPRPGIIGATTAA